MLIFVLLSTWTSEQFGSTSTNTSQIQLCVHHSPRHFDFDTSIFFSAHPTDSNSQHFARRLTDPPRRSKRVLRAHMILGRHRRLHLVLHALLEFVLVMATTMTVLLLLLGRLFLVVWRRMLRIVTVPLSGGRTGVVSVLGGVGRRWRCRAGGVVGPGTRGGRKAATADSQSWGVLGRQNIRHDVGWWLRNVDRERSCTIANRSRDRPRRNQFDSAETSPWQGICKRSNRAVYPSYGRTQTKMSD
jgi:hypothetical protein